MGSAYLFPLHRSKRTGPIPSIPESTVTSGLSRGSCLDLGPEECVYDMRHLACPQMPDLCSNVAYTVLVGSRRIGFATFLPRPSKATSKRMGGLVH